MTHPEPSALTPRETDLRSERLTPREAECVEAMRTARTEAEAAGILGLSPFTVHAYLRSARSKLNVRTTRALVIAVGPTHEQA